MAGAEAARKFPLQLFGRADSQSIPEVLRKAAKAGDDGCEFGGQCLGRPANWPGFQNWILRSVAGLIPDGLELGVEDRWRVLGSRPDPDDVSKIARDCARCSRYVNDVIQTTSVIQKGRLRIR